MKALIIAVSVTLLAGCYPMHAGFYHGYSYAGTLPRYRYYDYRVDPYTAEYRALVCRAGEYAMPLRYPMPVGYPCMVFLGGYQIQGFSSRR